MWISKAYAAATDEANDIAIDTLGPEPSAFEILIMNLGVPVVLVVLFYILLIMPQQRRFKEHATMLSELKKGDRVVTSGGLIGIIDTITKDSDEVVLEIAKGVKITALRSMIQSKNETENSPEKTTDKKSKTKK